MGGTRWACPSFLVHNRLFRYIFPVIIEFVGKFPIPCWRVACMVYSWQRRFAVIVGIYISHTTGMK